MRLDGQFTVNAAQADVYTFLTDPATVSRHMPDVKNVVIEDADHFTVTARVGVSHIKGDVVMKLAIKDRQPPVSTTVVGKGTGLASAVDMVTSFTLTSAGAGETVVDWQGDVTISGKLAAFGPQGLLDRIARKISTRSSRRSGADCLAATGSVPELDRRAAAAGAGESSPSAIAAFPCFGYC